MTTRLVPRAVPRANWLRTKLLATTGERDRLEHQLNGLRKQWYVVIRDSNQDKADPKAIELAGQIEQLNAKVRELTEEVRAIKTELYPHQPVLQKTLIDYVEGGAYVPRDDGRCTG